MFSTEFFINFFLVQIYSIWLRPKALSNSRRKGLAYVWFDGYSCFGAEEIEENISERQCGLDQSPFLGTWDACYNVQW